jgi:flagellar hook-associated protein FlgK
MTVEERFERIEHVTAGLVEDRRRDREEYKMLWRDTQRQLNELAVRVNDLTSKIADTNDTITRVAEEMRAADEKLGKRIDSLVSAIGEFMRKQNGSP